jgi:hypothetical protein
MNSCLHPHDPPRAVSARHGKKPDAASSWHDRRVTHPARELADLRAWLTAAIRTARREPGPDGLTILSAPSDRELIDEVRRLRRLADQAGSAMPLAAYVCMTGPSLAVRVPDPLKLGSRDFDAAPVLIRVVETCLAEPSVDVLLVPEAVAENTAGVMYLDLPNGPTVIVNVEIPDRAAPAVELITTGLVPATAVETARHGGKLPPRGVLNCRCDTMSHFASGLAVRRTGVMSVV